MSGLKRRLDDVVAAADAATAELEAAKRAREAAETELRGTQVQVSIAAATIQIQALEVSPRLPSSLAPNLRIVSPSNSAGMLPATTPCCSCIWNQSAVAAAAASLVCFGIEKGLWSLAGIVLHLCLFKLQ